MKEIGLMIYSMVTALKYSKMVRLIKANMKWALNRVEVFANGQMEESMTGNLFKIKNKVMDFTSGQMERHMKDIGLKENSMVKVNLRMQKINRGLENGNMELEQHGYLLMCKRFLKYIEYEY